jgi:hypothetical protein
MTGIRELDYEFDVIYFAKAKESLSVHFAGFVDQLIDKLYINPSQPAAHVLLDLYSDYGHLQGRSGFYRQAWSERYHAALVDPHIFYIYTYRRLVCDIKTRFVEDGNMLVSVLRSDPGRSSSYGLAGLLELIFGLGPGGGGRERCSKANSVVGG